MTAVAVLLAAAVISWGYRVAFVAVVPGERIPKPVRARLDDVAPAAFAALIGAKLAGAVPLDPVGVLAATAVAAAVAWRTRNHLATVAAGVTTLALVQAVT